MHADKNMSNFSQYWNFNVQAAEYITTFYDQQITSCVKSSKYDIHDTKHQRLNKKNGRYWQARQIQYTFMKM